MRDSFKSLYFADIHSYGSGKVLLYLKAWHFFYRKSQTRKNPITRVIFKSLFRIHSRRHGIEIPTCTKIGKGLYLGHAYNITINGDTVIGENCHIHKGVTIGLEPRGKRAVTPTIGNYVSICINATVVGKITIGDDVLIAPGALVNCNVPSHSVVLGNPCTIHHRDHATEGYI